MSELFKNNTYLTDLKVGDKVVEHHKVSTLRYVSKVESISNDTIVVRRPNNVLVNYDRISGRIRVPYGTVIPNFYLVQYVAPSAPTPMNPGAVSDSAENVFKDVIFASK